MKEKSNNEIDLLLRRMGRQDGDSVGNADQHLDVDELSSYAQNALPAAARARYTTHLAECSACRKLVTELSVSLGATVAAVAPVETVSVPGGLKKFLVSLFSPMVLRYAVPALGLLIVAFIGFVTLRQQDRQIATLSERPSLPATASPSISQDNSSPSAGFIDPKRETAAASPVDQPKQRAEKSGEPADEAAGTGPVLAAPPIRREAPAEEPKPAVAEAEPPPAKAASPVDTEDRKKLEAAKKQADTAAVETKEAQISTANEPARGANYQRAPQATAQAKDENKTKSLPLKERGATVGGAARVFSTGSGEADKNDSDTRSISGRRFRKERGIWTDTAYDSSTATVNVARGSEQFRALVADEPEIKKIAEQLDGEVIVVWKGRAYRIR